MQEAKNIAAHLSDACKMFSVLQYSITEPVQDLR